MSDFWNEKYVLMDLLFSTNMSLVEIAKELGVSPANLSKQIRDLDLDWVKRRKNRKMSRGQSCLTATMKKIFPNQLIENEYHIGEKLRLDVFCPTYKVAAEYHGRQHYEHVVRFHSIYEDFKRAQERDLRKIELCKEQDITLIVFKYNDDLSESTVYDRVLSAIIEDTPSAAQKRTHKQSRHSMKGTPLYEEIKSKRKEFEGELRAKMREERKRRRKEIT